MNGMVIIKVGADWCKPCVELSKTYYTEVVDKFKSFTNVNFKTFDVSDLTSSQKEKLAYWGVTLLPSIVIMVDGIPKHVIQSSDTSTLVEFISNKIRKYMNN